MKYTTAPNFSATKNKTVTSIWQVKYFPLHKIWTFFFYKKVVEFMLFFNEKGRISVVIVIGFILEEMVL